MLSKKIESDLKKVAKDPGVQMSCVNAMFNECERGSDLWESLWDDRSTFLKSTEILLWGPDMPEPETPEEEMKQEEDRNDLFSRAPSHETIGYLLDQVEINLRKKVGDPYPDITKPFSTRREAEEYACSYECTRVDDKFYSPYFKYIKQIDISL